MLRSEGCRIRDEVVERESRRKNKCCEPHKSSERPYAPWKQSWRNVETRSRGGNTPKTKIAKREELRRGTPIGASGTA